MADAARGIDAERFDEWPEEALEGLRSVEHGDPEYTYYLRDFLSDLSRP